MGIKAHGKGLMLSILRYAQELRDETPYFDRVEGEADPEAVALAVELINKQSGKFEPKTMPDQFTAAVKEYLRAKVEQRAPEVTIEKEGKPAPQVINIMDALKKSVQAKGRTKVRAAVGKHMGQCSDQAGDASVATTKANLKAYGTLNHAVAMSLA